MQNGFRIFKSEHLLYFLGLKADFKTFNGLMNPQNMDIRASHELILVVFTALTRFSVVYRIKNMSKCLDFANFCRDCHGWTDVKYWIGQNSGGLASGARVSAV